MTKSLTWDRKIHSESAFFLQQSQLFFSKMRTISMQSFWFCWQRKNKVIYMFHEKKLLRVAFWMEIFKMGGETSTRKVNMTSPSWTGGTFFFLFFFFYLGNTGSTRRQHCIIKIAQLKTINYYNLKQNMKSKTSISNKC